MKYKFLSLSIVAFATISLGQNPPGPCCTVIGINPARNTVYATNKTTGQIFMYRVSPAEIHSIKLNEAVSTNSSFTYVIDKENGSNKYFVGPVNFIESDTTGSTGIVHINYLQPCCAIINIDKQEPCCNMVIAQNRSSGETFRFKAPAEVGKSFKIGDAVFPETLDGSSQMVVVQSYYGGTGKEMNSFAYQREQPGVNTEDLSVVKWELYRVHDMKGSLGKLNTNFPDDVEWGIDIYSNPQHRFLVNRSGTGKQSFYDIAPGNYDFRLNAVMVEKVPIEQGKMTRLKAGYLSIVSAGDWDLYDETKTRFYISGNRPKKIAIPVGNYQLKLGNQFLPLTISDRKISEF